MSVSNSETPRRPVILVDMDGPLADFEGAFYDLCADEKFLMHDGRVNKDNPCTKHRFLADCLQRGDRGWARYHVEKRPWFRDLPVMPGAIEGINELAEHADVWICTKPLESNYTCRDDKAFWIRHHLGLEWEQRLILAPNKGMVRGDLLLDDAPKHDWLPYATWKPVMFTMPWNGAGSKWDGIPHWVWGDPVEDLLELAETLHAPHGSVEDGFGGEWLRCAPDCSLEVVRPGKVQCNDECSHWFG